MSTPESPPGSFALPFHVVPDSPQSSPDRAWPPPPRIGSGEDEVLRYREYLLSEGYSPRTARIYATHLRRWTMRLGRPAAEAGPAELRDYLLQLAARCRPATLGQVRSALRIHYHRVVRRPRLAEIILAVRPIPGPPPRALDPEELWKVQLAARTSRERIFVILLAESGVRSGELLGLRVRDIDFLTGTLRITGSCGHVHRTVGFPARIGLDLADEIRGRFPHQWLFPGRLGRPLTSRTLQKTLAAISRRIGLDPPATARVLRQTFARNLVGKGLGHKEIARRLGLRTTAGVGSREAGGSCGRGWG